MHAVASQRRSLVAVRALAAFCAAVAFTGGPALAHSPRLDAEPLSDAAQSAVQHARGLTLALLDASRHARASALANTQKSVSTLVATARSRHDAILELIGVDAGEAFKATLPAELRAQLPADVAPFLEQDAVEEGEIEVAHVDYEDPSLDHYEYALNTPRGRLALHFAKGAPDIVTGTHVRVSALRIDDVLLAASGDSVVTVTKAAALPNTLGAQKTLTILVNYTTSPVQPFTVASAQSMMFSTMSSFWYENSYQQTTLTGDVAGWFTIAPSATTCDYTYVESKAKSAAQAAGYNLSNYTRFLYVMPASGCSWAGLSYVGGTPSRSWVISGYFRLSTIAHELGHALGLYHAHSLDCGTAAIAATGCAKSEYGDVFDVMGTASTHYNAFQKERLGWLNAGVSPPIITLASSGSASYTISPFERTRDATPRALKIPRAAACGTASDYFYVESRQAIGFDAGFASNTSMITGVLVHDATPSSPDSSYLLDMTPATAAWSDAALRAGLAFTDPSSGVTIAPLSVASTGSTISVSYPPAACTHAAPTLTLTPTGTAYASAGSTTTYTATIKNNDSCGCPSSPFVVTAAVPNGWSASNLQTGSIAPGASATAALGVTAPGSAAPAYYTITGAATNAMATTYSDTATGTIAIMGALAVSGSSDKAVYARPARPNLTTYAVLSTTVTSGGVPVPGAAVTVKVRDPKGSTTTLSATSASNGVAAVSYAIKSKMTAGSYAVSTTAASGGMTNSASFAFTVQ